MGADNGEVVGLHALGTGMQSRAQPLLCPHNMLIEPTFDTFALQHACESTAGMHQASAYKTKPWFCAAG
jgi:hypothetical protein